MADEDSMRIVTINDIVDSKRFKITIDSHDTPAEIRARLDRGMRRASFDRSRDLVLLIATTLAVATFVVVCVSVVLSRSATSDDKKWAISVLSSIVAGSVGFLFGKSARPEAQ